MVDGLGTTTYAYQAAGQSGAGQLASSDGPRSNDTLTYTYDELSRVVTRALNGVGVTWAFDALDRLTSEVNPLGTFACTYDGATPRLATSTYPNGQTSLYIYVGNSGDHRLQTIHHKTPGGTTLSKFDYTYDAIGNILSWQQQADTAAPTVWSYSYDSADQLVSAIERATDPSQTVLARYGYTYDPAGDRTAEQIDDVATGATHDALNRLLTHTAAGSLRIAGTLSEPATVSIDGVAAAVDAANSFSGLKTLTAGSNTFTVTARDYSGNTRANTYEVDAAGQTGVFTYDANGNMTADGTRTFEWDAENRLVAVNISTHRSEFTYDGESHRTRIIEKESGVIVRDAQLFWADTDIIEERLSTGEVNRFFADSEEENGVAHYISRDHLGSVRELVDSAASVVARNAYDPLGRSSAVVGTGTGMFGFAGQVPHAPSHTTLAVHRAYDPEVGRWLSEDPLGFVDGPNRYAYVRNNPIRYLDPSGTAATHLVNTGGGRRISDGPTNGNWGGKCWSGGQYACGGNPTGNSPPTDSADACYMHHDNCYSSCGGNATCMEKCDQTLVDNLDKLSSDPRKWPHPPRPGTEEDSADYRLLAQIYFRRGSTPNYNYLSYY